jgi:apolipoprotein N-acyltransferase
MAPNLVSLVAGVGVTAFSFQLLKVLVDALVGRAAPDEVRGRVFSVYDVLYNVAFVLAGLVMVPLWDPTRVRALLWWLAAAFLLGWLGCARLFGAWPFGTRRVVQRPTRGWRGRLLAVGSGALPVLAFPQVAWWWFAWLCLIPLLLVVRAAPTPREAGIRGWCAGAGYIAGSAYWLAPAVGPALVLVAFGLGSLWLPWSWAAWRMLAVRPSTSRLLGATVLLPAGWSAIEAVRSWPSLGGPWALLGASQWNQPTMLASAALGGVWLTGFLIVAVNVAVLAAAIAAGRTARIVLVGVATAALAVGPVWAAVRPSLPTTGATRIAVVQPGVMERPAARLERQVGLTESLTADGPDLIVWGESSVAYDLESSPEVTDRLVALARRTGADLLVNVDARRDDGGIFKTSVLVTPSGLDGSYVKTRLVPFGEYVPLRPLLGWLSRVSDAAGQDRGRGAGPAVLRSGPTTLGPLICFESTFPDMARREVALGADLIVYQTASTTFQGTWAQPQHASLAAVRAVETGRPVVHAALTGTTAAYDATGHQLMWIDPAEQDTALSTVTLTGGRTPYDVAGDWLLAVAAALIAAGLAGTSLTSRNTTEPGDTFPRRW